VSRKRSPKQKLVGWGILAGVAVLIVVVFLITRLATTPSTPTTVATGAPSSAPSTEASAAASASVATAATENSSTGQAPSSQQVSAAQSADAAARTTTAAIVDANAMDQQSRKDMLLKLINQGVFTGIVADVSPPRVGVTDLFKGLSPSIQSEFAALVYAYVNNGRTGKDPLQIIDVQTGASAGTYTADGGLKLL